MSQNNLVSMTVASKRQVLVVDRLGISAELRRGPRATTSLPPHFHEETQVILSEHRLISYTVGGAKALSPLGSIFLIRPFAVHSAVVEDVQPAWGDLRTLLISGSCFAAFLGEHAAGLPPNHASPVCRSPALQHALAELHAATLRTHNNLQYELILVRALTALIVQGQPSEVRRTRRCDRRLSRVREYLGSDLERNMSLAEVARCAELSPFHVAREFQKAFGISPHAFRVQLRLSRAKELLRARHTIGEVAQSTGFSDHAHLTRPFQRYVGVPPSRYIRSKIVQDTLAEDWYRHPGGSTHG